MLYFLEVSLPRPYTETSYLPSMPHVLRVFSKMQSQILGKEISVCCKSQDWMQSTLILYRFPIVKLLLEMMRQRVTTIFTTLFKKLRNRNVFILNMKFISQNLWFLEKFNCQKLVLKSNIFLPFYIFVCYSEISIILILRLRYLLNKVK